MYAPELNSYRLKASFRTDLEVVHQLVPDAEVRAMEIMLAPWASNVDTEAIIARFPNVVHVVLTWLGLTYYMRSALPLEEWAGIVRRAAAIPGLETVTFSLSTLDSTGELHAAYLREFRAKYVQVNSVLTMPALERALRPVPSATGVGFINNMPYEDSTPLLRSLQAKRHPYYKIVTNSHRPEVLGLLHPGLLGFSMELRRDRVSMAPSDLDALALALRGCPRLREFTLGWFALDSRSFDLSELALTISALPLEIAIVEMYGGVFWGANNLQLLNAMLRPEGIRIAYPGREVPRVLMSGSTADDAFIRRLKAAVEMYGLAMGPAALPPEMILPINRAAFGVSEHLVVLMREAVLSVPEVLRRDADAVRRFALETEPAPRD